MLWSTILTVKMMYRVEKKMFNENGNFFRAEVGKKVKNKIKKFKYLFQIFGQNCSLPFSLRRLDIPALLKSWQKH
jgi:hypothetical protein